MAKLLQYYIHKVISKIKKNPDEYMNQFFRRNEIQVGSKCHIYSNIISSEPFLIEIGDMVTVSSDVLFCTHDNSIIKADKSMYNLFGKIKIGNNCFIGQRSMLMYGITLADNIIVAAGSVVANSFDEERIIIGGVPAKKIGTFDQFVEKNIGKALPSGPKLKEMIKEHPDVLIERKPK